MIRDIGLLRSSAHHFFARFEIDADNQPLAILMLTRE